MASLRALAGLGLLLLCGCSGSGASSDKDSQQGGSSSGGNSSNGSGGTAKSTGGAAPSTGGSVNAGAPSSAAAVYGEAHTGQYHLGPVDFAESEWHNACAPSGGYRSELRDASGLGGEYLAGVSNDYLNGGAVCDACILV